jgi:hypothetical protein
LTSPAPSWMTKPSPYQRYRVKAITTAAVGGLIGADHLEDTGMIAFVSGASRSSPARGDDPIARGWRVS